MWQKPFQLSSSLRKAAVRIAGVVLAASAVTVGCSSGSHPAASTSSKPPPAVPTSALPASNTGWNPCSIPDVDIAAVGLSPKAKRPDSVGLGTKFPGWDICDWRSDAWYFFGVYSTNAHSYDEVIHNTTVFIGTPEPVTVAGRNASQLHPVDDPTSCSLIFDVVTGVVQLEVAPKGSVHDQGYTGDVSCAEVARIAGVLVKDLPPAK